MEEEYSKLLNEDKYWWYPQNLAYEQHKVKSIITRDQNLLNLGYRLPYHASLLVDYTVLYNTVDILQVKIKNVIRALKRININMPHSGEKTERVGYESIKQPPFCDLRGSNISTLQLGNITTIGNQITSGEITINNENSSNIAPILEEIIVSSSN